MLWFIQLDVHTMDRFLQFSVILVGLSATSGQFQSNMCLR